MLKTHYRLPATRNGIIGQNEASGRGCVERGSLPLLGFHFYQCLLEATESNTWFDRWQQRSLSTVVTIWNQDAKQDIYMMSNIGCALLSQSLLNKLTMALPNMIHLLSSLCCSRPYLNPPLIKCQKHAFCLQISLKADNRKVPPVTP